jgi:hypothetical protein
MPGATAYFGAEDKARVQAHLPDHERIKGEL